VVHQYTRQIIPKIEPLFPCYIFARFQATALLHKIRLTRGIHSVVSFGDKPSAVDDEIIDLLKVRVEEDGFVKVEQRLKKGDKVVINNGPLEGLNGIFEAETKPLDRVCILLTTVRYQARLVIDRNIVQLTN
jgi:transcriptional antiterminator RfaH